MIDNEEDEWLPELKQKDSILNRIFVNFTSRNSLCFFIIFF